MNVSTLIQAVKDNNFLQVKQCIEKYNCDINFRERPLKLCPLSWACWKGNINIAKYLISVGADVNNQDSVGMTPLHYAISYNHFDIITLLIEVANADINMKTDTGLTGLMLACQNGNFEIVTYLIANGADIYLKDDVNRRAIDLSTNESIKQMIRNLYITKDEEKRRAHLLLKEQRALKEEVTKNELIIATIEGNIDRVQEAVEVKHIDVNSKTKSGKTPLMISVIFDHKDIAKYLIRKNADTKIKDKFLFGKTAIEYSPNEEMKQVISEALSRRLESKKRPSFAKPAEKIEDSRSIIEAHLRKVEERKKEEEKRIEESRQKALLKISEERRISEEKQKMESDRIAAEQAKLIEDHAKKLEEEKEKNKQEEAKRKQILLDNQTKQVEEERARKLEEEKEKNKQEEERVRKLEEETKKENSRLDIQNKQNVHVQKLQEDFIKLEKKNTELIAKLYEEKNIAEEEKRQKENENIQLLKEYIKLRDEIGRISQKESETSHNETQKIQNIPTNLLLAALCLLIIVLLIRVFINASTS